LQFEHHVVEAVFNGEDALRLLRGYQYDVVVLDWQLPKMSGVDVCSISEEQAARHQYFCSLVKQRSKKKKQGWTPVLTITWSNLFT